jgi:predicted transcriptional regulator
MSVSENERIRGLLAEHLSKLGVKQSHISEITGISRTSICLFLSNKRRLAPKVLEKIENAISS